MKEKPKPARRKTWAFYSVLFSVCVPSAIRFEMNWPLAALTGGIFLVFIGAISTEKIMLELIKKKASME